MSAYAFQYYFFQVIQALKEEYGEHNAFKSDADRKAGRYPCDCCIFSAGFAIGLVALTIMFLFYFSILLIQLYSLGASKDTDPNDVSKHILWTIIQASFGFKLQHDGEHSWPLIVAI